MSKRPLLRRGPSGPLAAKGGLGLIQVGYDQSVTSQTLPAAVTPFSVTVPRNATPDPLQVVLPDVTPGNVLEIDFDLNLLNGGEGAAAFNAMAVVSFKDAPVFPGDFFAINNSQASLQPLAGQEAIWRSLSAVVIPVDAKKATVRVAYDDNDTGGFQIGGTDAFPQSPGSTLKASEIDSLSVPQPGPSALVPVP